MILLLFKSCRTTIFYGFIWDDVKWQVRQRCQYEWKLYTKRLEFADEEQETEKTKEAQTRFGDIKPLSRRSSSSWTQRVPDFPLRSSHHGPKLFWISLRVGHRIEGVAFESLDDDNNSVLVLSCASGAYQILSDSYGSCTIIYDEFISILCCGPLLFGLTWPPQKHLFPSLVPLLNPLCYLVWKLMQQIFIKCIRWTDINFRNNNRQLVSVSDLQVKGKTCNNQLLDVVESKTLSGNKLNFGIRSYA